MSATASFVCNVAAAYNLSVVGLVMVYVAASLSTGAGDAANPGDLALVGASGMIGAAAGQMLMGFLGGEAAARRPANGQN